jgi:hypothetical protein
MVMTLLSQMMKLTLLSPYKYLASKIGDVAMIINAMKSSMKLPSSLA